MPELSGHNQEWRFSGLTQAAAGTAQESGILTSTRNHCSSRLDYRMISQTSSNSTVCVYSPA